MTTPKKVEGTAKRKWKAKPVASDWSVNIVGHDGIRSYQVCRVWRKEDAPIIVHRVNTYEALVEALEKIAKLEETDSIGHDLLADIDAVLKKVRG